MSAAGERLGDINKMINYEEFGPKFNLSNLSRDAIRNHLLDIDPHENLFVRIPKLGLPAPVQRFLQLGLSLGDGEENDDDK